MAGPGHAGARIRDRVPGCARPALTSLDPIDADRYVRGYAIPPSHPSVRTDVGGSRPYRWNRSNGSRTGNSSVALNWEPKSPFVRLEETELEEKLVRASGPGGQNVNKVATKVVLRHRPSNLTVTVQDSRSQAANRKLARERLLNLLRSAAEKARAERRRRREQRRRQNAPRPAAVKRRMVEYKRRRGALKQGRAQVSEE